MLIQSFHVPQGIFHGVVFQLSRRQRFAAAALIKHNHPIFFEVKNRGMSGMSLSARTAVRQQNRLSSLFPVFGKINPVPVRLRQIPFIERLGFPPF